MPTNAHLDSAKFEEFNKMYGACFLVIFEVRRGQEGLDLLVLADFKLVEDETFNYRYYSLTPSLT